LSQDQDFLRIEPFCDQDSNVENAILHVGLLCILCIMPGAWS